MKVVYHSNILYKVTKKFDQRQGTFASKYAMRWLIHLHTDMCEYHSYQNELVDNNSVYLNIDIYIH